MARMRVNRPVESLLAAALLLSLLFAGLADGSGNAAKTKTSQCASASCTVSGRAG
jgi:hypothetical protein